MSAHDAAQEVPVVLVHGGLGEAMDSERFWVQSGVVAALVRAGRRVLAPDRDTAPASWSAAGADLARSVVDEFGGRPVDVVAGSNGVSVALRCAIDSPSLVRRLVLAWPATAGDPSIDASVPERAHHLLVGDTIRGLRDVELRAVDVPVVVVPATPEGPAHRHSTAQRLASLVHGAALAPGCPEPLQPRFADHLATFVRLVMA